MKTKSFESLCRKNRKLILEALYRGGHRCEYIAWSTGSETEARKFKRLNDKFKALRAQLMEAK